MSYNARKLALLYKEKKGKEWNYRDISRLREYSNITETQADYIINALKIYKLDIHLFLERTLDFYQLQVIKSEYKFDEIKFKTALSAYMDRNDDNNLKEIYEHCGIPEHLTDKILEPFKNLQFLFNFKNGNVYSMLQSFERNKLMYEQCLAPYFIVQRLIDKHYFICPLKDEEISLIIKLTSTVVNENTLIDVMNNSIERYNWKIERLPQKLFTIKYDYIMFNNTSHADEIFFHEF
jgi:hypothetical protein